MSSLEGQLLLGQYRVDAFVASGGMGTVYRVWDLKRNVPLAMKVLHADLAEDPSVFKRFQREARALQKLAHPNIVPFYGLYQARGVAFLLERFIDGPSLKDLLRRRKGKPLPIEQMLVFLKAVSSALGYAHAHAVVHCDIKPGNVMIDEGGSVFLTDFGVARHAESTTTTLGLAGTAAYMAPEQCRGEAVTAATDVYALGVMLYEMLTGERPFRGDDEGTESSGATAAERIRYAHVHREPPDPRQANPAISETMAGVIRRALAKEPGERYGGVRELFEEACRAVGVAPQDVPDWVGVQQALAPARRGRASTSSSGALVGEEYGLAAQASLSSDKAANRALPRLIGAGCVAAIGLVGAMALMVFLVIRVGVLLSRALSNTLQEENGIQVAAAGSEAESTSTPAPTRAPTETTTPTPSPTPTLIPSFKWSTSTLRGSETEKVGLFSSLAIDTNGNYHVGYFEDSDDTLRYAKGVSDEWHFGLVTGGSGKGFHLSLDIDQGGYPHLAGHVWGRDKTPSLYYWYQTGMGWTSAKVSDAEVTNTDISLALGPDDSPHLAFQDRYDFRIKVAHFTGSVWDIQAVDLADSNCQSFPLAVDESGIPHLAYCANGGGLNYATLRGQTWQIETVDGHRGAGLYSSLTLDSSGRPHIAYYDRDDRTLNYAYLESDWVLQTIDAIGDVGQYPSIVIDSMGHVHVSYYDATNSSLKYAHGRDGQWNIYTVDEFGDTGKWNSIALDPNDLPSISYMDDGKKDLKLAWAVPLFQSPPETSP